MDLIQTLRGFNRATTSHKVHPVIMSRDTPRGYSRAVTTATPPLSQWFGAAGFEPIDP